MNAVKPIEFTNEQLRLLQLKELESLLYFRDFCEENNLLFYFCGGCCIGALRNGGFVPWDDDVDIFMPRPDYEKLCRIWKKRSKNPRFKLLRTDGNIFTGNIFTTLVDTNYTLIKANQIHLDIPFGLVTDIFPIDGCPQGIKRKFQKMWAMVYSLFLAQVVPEKHGGIAAFGSKVLLTVFRGKKIREKIWRLAEKKMSKYKIKDCKFITELCAGPGYMRNEYPKEAFASALYKDFEGYKMPIPAGYDEYLKIAFGDYMALPSEEKRKPHHDVVYCDLNSTYEQSKEKIDSEIRNK